VVGRTDVGGQKLTKQQQEKIDAVIRGKDTQGL